jgi:hypothetical protein
MNPTDGKYLNNSGSYTVSDPTNKGVMRYQAHKKPVVSEERHQKELEDNYRK